MKSRSAVVGLFVLGVFLANVMYVGASPDQRRFSLAYFDVDVAYPASAKPGEVVTISIAATAKKECEVQDLSVEFFVYSTSGEPKSIGSTSLVKQASVASGNSFQKSAGYTIPTDAPRSFLMAVASETVRTYSYTYPYYYSYPYWWWYNTTHYWWWYPVYYSWRTYVDTVDREAGPLTYVLATTLEYIQLKAEYDKLTSDYNKLSSDYSTLSARYDRLNEEHKALIADNENLTQNLALMRIAVYCLVAALVVFAVFAYLQRKKTIVAKSEKPATKQ